MPKREFSTAFAPLIEAWNQAEAPKFFGVVLDYERENTVTGLLGNVSAAAHLVTHGLDYVMPTLRDAAVQCPCDRCLQNLDKLERVYAILCEPIAADRN